MSPADAGQGGAPGFRLVDSETTPFVPVAGNEGAMRRFLRTDADGRNSIYIADGPPGFTQTIRDLLADGPLRHYHRSVTERHFMLAGDYPIRHWHDPDDAAGQLTLLRPNSYLENPPGAVHGVSLECVPSVATRILVWADGRGNNIHDPEAATETIDLPFTADGHRAPWHVRPIICAPGAETWRPHPSIDGAEIASLSSPQRREDGVWLVRLPDGARSAGVAGGADHWFFMLSGAASAGIAGHGASEQVVLAPGSFLEWGEGSVLTISTPVAGPPALLLCVGQCLGAGGAESGAMSNQKEHDGAR